MVNQELLDYIKGQTEEGTSREDIKKALTENGWASTDIAKAFSEIQPSSASIPSAPAIQYSPVPSNLPKKVKTNSFAKGQRQLHPRAVWMFVLDRIILWFIVGFAISSTYIIASLRINNRNEPLDFSFIKFLLLTIVIFIIETLIIYLISKLTYKFYKFELTETEYKQERGVISKSYVSIPYERIQNINISRGIIDRLLGLSHLSIQTAGANFGSEGILYGLGFEEAEELRAELMERARNANK